MEGELRTTSSQGSLHYRGVDFRLNQEPSNRISIQNTNRIPRCLSTVE